MGSNPTPSAKKWKIPLYYRGLFHVNFTFNFAVAYEQRGAAGLNRQIHLQSDDTGHRARWPCLYCPGGKSGGLFRVDMTGGEIEEADFKAEFAASDRGLPLFLTAQPV